MGPRLRPEDVVKDGEHVSLAYIRPKNPCTVARAALKNLTAAHCNIQAQSPLFAVLAPELRDMICDLVFQPVPHDPASEEDIIGASGRRSGRGKARTCCTVDTALLRTCRLIYVEAKYMPVRNATHSLYSTMRGLFGGIRDPENPYYNEGKFSLRASRFVCASSPLHYTKMSPKIQAEIRRVRLYNINQQAYYIGHDFWDMKAVQPRVIFIACPFNTRLNHVIVNKKKQSGWHDTLEKLTMRIDIHPNDLFRFEREPMPKSQILKEGGSVLNMVDAESKTRGTWSGLDKRGQRVEWHSVTYVWM